MEPLLDDFLCCTGDLSQVPLRDQGDKHVPILGMCDTGEERCPRTGNYRLGRLSRARFASLMRSLLRFRSGINIKINPLTPADIIRIRSMSILPFLISRLLFLLLLAEFFCVVLSLIFRKRSFLAPMKSSLLAEGEPLLAMVSFRK